MFESRTPTARTGLRARLCFPMLMRPRTNAILHDSSCHETLTYRFAFGSSACETSGFYPEKYNDHSNLVNRVTSPVQCISSPPHQPHVFHGNHTSPTNLTGSIHDSRSRVNIVTNSPGVDPDPNSQSLNRLGISKRLEWCFGHLTPGVSVLKTHVQDSRDIWTVSFEKFPRKTRSRLRRVQPLFPGN